MRYVRFSLRLVQAWIKTFRNARKADRFHFTIGQTWISFLRDSVPVSIVRMLNRNALLVFSLNGHLFMRWALPSLKASAFRSLLNQASVVTVVGPSQQRFLTDKLRILRPNVAVLDNPSDIQPIAGHLLQEKQSVSNCLKILHLSNLIETKGFPIFLETLELLSEREGIPIEACLAGDFVMDRYRNRFQSQAEAEEWIKGKISRINSSGRVRVTWVRSATGAIKESLFRDAHIFFFPSTYPVEAQPLVLIEALAAGCVIISSKAGEIPFTIPEGAGVLLDDCAPSVLAAEIERMASPKQRLPVAEAARKLYGSRYALEHYRSRFEALLNFSAAT